MKSDKMLYVTYADIKSLINKNQIPKKNPKKSQTAKIEKHILYGYLILTTWAFDHIENKHNLYRGKDCMKNFCETLREHLKNVIDFENKVLP